MPFLNLSRWLAPGVPARARRNTLPAGATRWSTSSYGTPADTSPNELCELSEHLDRCHRMRGWYFRALCVTDTVDRFLAPRLMTTLLAGVVVGALLATM